MKYHHGKWLVEIILDIHTPHEAEMTVREDGKTPENRNTACIKLNMVELAARFKKQTTVREASRDGQISDHDVLMALMKGGVDALDKKITVLDKDSYFDYMALRLIDYGIQNGYWEK
jgi:hypothetical protein